MKLSLTTSRYFSVCLCMLFSYALFVSNIAPFAPQSTYADTTSSKADSSTRNSVLASRNDSAKQSNSRGAISFVQSSSQAQSRSGEVLVRFRATASEGDKDVVALTHGANRKKLRGASGLEKLGTAAGQSPETLALALSQEPEVEFAEPNFLIKPDQTSTGAVPSDAQFAEQWALRNTGQNGGQYGSDIGVTSAWEKTTGTPATVIAVIDSGIDFSHPDLVNNQWTNPEPSTAGDLHGWDYTTDNGTIKDEQGHGTAIAGIIAAQGNNSAGISGVMWRASLMSLRVLDNTGTGDIGNAVEAIDYAVAHGAQVINISWGTSGESLALKDVIERAMRNGVVVVCSAGNGSQDVEATPYYPASYGLRDLIAVGATDNFDRLTTWSNWGSRNVTVAAPGIDVLTTKMGGGYWNVTGTSASAPLVAGVAGLIKSVNPALNTNDVAQAIENEVRKVASLSGKVSSGGVVSASASVAKVHRSPGRPVLAPSGYGSGGTGPGGTFSATPPQQGTSIASALPNLDQTRNTQPEQPRTRQPIESNLPCLDCEPGGGGGGGYYPAGDPDFSTARELPRNETGQPGVNLGSRNFNWSSPMIDLKGRAGLDLNLTLFYNSLVWTKDSTYIKYNADLGSPAPGFRLALPTLQQRFLNPQTGMYAYMMVTPSGSRVELRQVGSSSVYESQDGSYIQLDMSNPNAPLVRTTDGTQMSFIPVTINSEYRCAQIKDRNGNYISATHDTTNGRLSTVTDTLGRVVSLVYDGSGNLSAIRQTWGGVTRDWATFYYGSVYVAPNFGGGLVVNGPNNTNVTVLTQVNLHDGSYFTFNYNSAFGQVNRINRHAADGHLLSYSSYNVSSASGQTDCPRFTERRDWAEFGVMNQSQEVLTTYTVATDGSWGQQTAPDGTIYKEFYSTTGWQSGLSYQSEVWSAGVRQKWTTTAWTQDDTNLSYQKNPRRYDISTYDHAGNRRRLDITYTSYSLPYEIREYAANASTFVRRTYIDYNFNAAYTNRRIIGLRSAVHVVDENNQYVSKMTYEYDWDNATNTYLIDQGAATQHDGANYSQSFIGGRGNLCAVRRWNVAAINDVNQAMWTSFSGYNTTGSTIFTADGLGHETRYGYADSFSDGVNRATFAYATSTTDGGGFSSTAQYNYDFGAVTRTQDPKGAVQTITYDSAARTSRVTSTFNSAYTRWVYPTAMNYVQQFSTIQGGAGEAYSAQFLDGWGKVRASVSDNPGSAGGFSATHVMYDAMGRVVQQSNPTEISEGWATVGDDAAGWVWTNQSYDWKGRPLVTTNADSSTTEASYGGCGCAGGEVMTVRDERGRRRKITKDVLGRLKQVDELNWDQSIYSTTAYTYNAGDQITSINQGGQIRSFVFDGHGRLLSRTTPEQGATNYTYLGDDNVQTITDARGAAATFSYNNRGLATNITYGTPGGVAATPNVSFDYDAAGNRTSMTDGLGSVSYAYNTLSQMTSETRTFTGLGSSYTLSYAYNLAGELTSITNPWSAQVGYSYDKIGRPTAITGAGYYGVGSYINSIAYRAFGMKQMASGNGRTLSVQYDNRMRATRWDIPGVMGWNYAYNYFGENTGRVTYAQNLYDATLDRSYDYDQVGRWVSGFTGSAARAHTGIGSSWLSDGPYAAHNNVYDVWGNTLSRTGWGGANPQFSAAYSNNRQNGMVYDTAGNLTSAGGGWTFTYDATGQQATSAMYNMQQSYDGNRLRGKKVENGVPTYYLRSSVLGGKVVAEIDGSGGWQRGYVYLGGETVAVQQAGVYWMHQDPVAKSKRVTDSAGSVVSTIELDPWGGETNRSSNEAFQPKKFTTYERDVNGSDEAMHRRYNRWWGRFEQPDPYEGSYSFTDPQSLNRYAYAQNDPVNFTDPTGLMSNADCTSEFNATGQCSITGGGSRPIDDPTSYMFVLGSRFGGFTGGTGGGPGGGRGPGTTTPPDTGNPQTPAPTQPDKFTDCANQAGVAATGLTEDAAKLILKISASEGTASNLLAYTWARESSFSMNPVPNTNGTTDTGRWDYGPFQINAYWIGRAISTGQVSADGINIGSALGGHGVRAGEGFAGDAYDNGRLAGRYLNSLGTGARAAGLYTGGTRVRDRSKGFNQWGSKFQAFFDCYGR
ncbi:MAG TPA: S8 family serine peptidase [Pyrinomonadaceae bacterium]|nr:S8 family serine peptidase [Pyrinomonadaceae bacterium]